VNGMATKKVTVTLDETQLERIRALVEAGSAPSVSGFVQHSVQVALDDVAGWGALLAEALRQTGGTLSEEERAWADGIPRSSVVGKQRGLMPGVTLDAGALLALEDDDRRVLVLLARARETGASVTIPATALAQATRAPARQVRLARLARQPTTDVVPLDRVDATSVGRLLAASGTADIVDAHVVICARRAAQHVVTSDSEDLLVLDPDLRVVRV
jgi:Arc/MetJ-type ribon-helix-helix transcriptional regulator